MSIFPKEKDKDEKLEITPPITVKELGEEIDYEPNQLIKSLMNLIWCSHLLGWGTSSPTIISTWKGSEGETFSGHLITGACFSLPSLSFAFNNLPNSDIPILLSHIIQEIS